MTELINPAAIERIVGVHRHATEHLGRAVSAEQRVYILHSAACAAATPDLRDCEYSTTLHLHGIDRSEWVGFEDRPVRLTIDPEFGDLIPAPLPDGPGCEHASRCCARHRHHVTPHRGCILR